MTTLESLQATLAAEHAAVYLFGVLGAQVSQEQDPARLELVVSRHALHRARRDDLVSMIGDLHEEPEAAEAAYQLPALGSVELVVAAGLLVEERCTAVYAALVAESSAVLRDWAIDALVESSSASLAWGGLPGSFPGAPEL